MPRKSHHPEHTGAHTVAQVEKSFLRIRPVLEEMKTLYAFVLQQHTKTWELCVSASSELASGDLPVSLLGKPIKFQVQSQPFLLRPPSSSSRKMLFSPLFKKISKINLKDSILQADIYCQCELTPSVSIWFTFHTHSEDPGTKVDVLTLL